MRLKEVSATILASIVSSGYDFDSIAVGPDHQTLVLEDIVHNLLHLIGNAGPAIECKLLQGVKLILDILLKKRTENLRRRAVWTVERILLTDEIAYEVSGDPNVNTALVDAFQHADYRTSQIAERALKHIDKIPNFSGIIPNMGCAYSKSFKIFASAAASVCNSSLCFHYVILFDNPEEDLCNYVESNHARFTRQLSAMQMLELKLENSKLESYR
ncbi:hypothetical protein Dsin_003901 [Dipteronia sinensis]|uniref:Uncharacterized protein n=1 Tax=Dipteronia sinensis TaxID=43782 RepID=A0AAE0B9T2_9ROSI|nr:hypothetical protein Dsin_003901 [Dipteronia sinensis]